MRPFFQALWAFAASLACLAVPQVASAGGLPEVDLVFPRNETYAPTVDMPFVFAFKNWDAESVSLLRPDIAYGVWYTSDALGGAAVQFSWRHQGTRANWSSHEATEPYFFHDFHSNFTVEGTVKLFWHMSWVVCDENKLNSSSPDWRPEYYRESVAFTVKNGGRAVDLEAATADKTSCTTELGVAVNVPDETRAVLSASRALVEGTCAVANCSEPAPTPSPCLVQVSSATAASISASWTARFCNPLQTLEEHRESRPDIVCPKHNAARQQVALTPVACLRLRWERWDFFWHKRQAAVDRTRSAKVVRWIVGQNQGWARGRGAQLHPQVAL
jgi:hypothetical protein